MIYFKSVCSVRAVDMRLFNCTVLNIMLNFAVDESVQNIILPTFMSNSVN